MTYWDNFNRYKPKPRRPVASGIKVKLKRGSVGDTWWSERWISVLESFNMGARLNRGRSYARSGQVAKIGVEPGVVKALVQGSARQPYIVVIRLAPLSDRQWKKTIEAMAAKAVFAAKLLSGEMPRDIEQSFAAAKCSLFPQKTRDLKTECDCPDWANPCKHVAAVYYVLGEMFDRDPFVIFSMRGRDRRQIIEALREKRSALAGGAVADRQIDAAGEAGVKPKPLEACLDSFWKSEQPQERMAFNLQRPAAEAALVKMLGPSPFNLGEQNVSEVLTEWYEAVSSAAEQLAME